MRNTFEETQKFRGKPLFFISLILISAVIVFGYAVVQQIFFDIPFGNKPAPDFVLVISLCMLAAALALVFITRLKTRITKESIAFAWWPFRKNFHPIKWDTVQKAEIISYGFVGYGLRFSSYGTVHTIGGNKGLLLILKSGKRIVIGTQKEDELTEFLQFLQPLQQ